MKLNYVRDRAGFTLAEMLVAVAIASMMLAAIITASIGLQKSFNAVDNFFAAQMQQIRIVDFLSRDVKRSYIVSTSPDRRTVTCTLPNYVVQPGDPDASCGTPGNPPTTPCGSTSNVNVGKRRPPTIIQTSTGKISVSYGARTVTDASITSGSANVTLSAADLVFGAGFTSNDVGQSVSGNGIPTGTTILSVPNCPTPPGCSTATMSNNATATVPGGTVTIGSLTTAVYSISGQSIQRTETMNQTTPQLTTIAASADNLIPVTTDVELANTEYTQATVTFLPIFTSNGATLERSGTTIFSLSYLRNKRRG